VKLGLAKTDRDISSIFLKYIYPSTPPYTDNSYTRNTAPKHSQSWPQTANTPCYASKILFLVCEIQLRNVQTILAQSQATANIDRHSDIQAKGNIQLLEKYGLKANDAILAEEKHMGLYDDLLNNYEAKLIAGGAAQNTARGAQVRAFSSRPS
jgi:hypothetical protein